MKGDVIIVEDHHRRAATAIVERIAPDILARDRRSTITVAGESGSGKSETGQALADALEARAGSAPSCSARTTTSCSHPSRTMRSAAADIGWVGSERGPARPPRRAPRGRPDGRFLGDEAARDLRRGPRDRGGRRPRRACGSRSPRAPTPRCCSNVDTRVFIARNRLETLDARMRRGREQFDPYIEQVLEIEHAIISAHRARADVVLSREYEVEFVEPTVRD